MKKMRDIKHLGNCLTDSLVFKTQNTAFPFWFVITSFPVFMLFVIALEKGKKKKKLLQLGLWKHHNSAWIRIKSTFRMEKKVEKELRTKQKMLCLLA